MKLIFLDVDGVLCNKRMDLDPKAVARVNRIVNETGAQIVLSSSWRNSESSYMKVGAVFASLMRTPTATAQIRWGSLARTWEILTFLGEHDVEQFVVIDDSNMEAFGTRMILTQFHELLTDEQTERAIQILRAK